MCFFFFYFIIFITFLFFFSSRRRHTRLQGDWSSDVCSSDLVRVQQTHGQSTRLPYGLKIIPWLVRLFITTRNGSANCRWRTQPSSSTAGCWLNHSQSTEPSPASGFTVKYPI